MVRREGKGAAALTGFGTGLISFKARILKFRWNNAFVVKRVKIVCNGQPPKCGGWRIWGADVGPIGIVTVLSLTRTRLSRGRPQ